MAIQSGYHTTTPPHTHTHPKRGSWLGLEVTVAGWQRSQICWRCGSCSRRGENVTLFCCALPGSQRMGTPYVELRVCASVYGIETEGLSDGWKWSSQSYSTLCNGCTSFLMWFSIGSLVRWALYIWGEMAQCQLLNGSLVRWSALR